MSAEPRAGPGATIRLAGIPIRVEPAFVLVLGLLGFAGRGTLLAAVEWVVLAGISILLHELGHAAAYRRFGVQPSIRLWSFGGLTYGEALTPARSVVVSLAGPVTGLLVGVAVAAVSWVVESVVNTGSPEFEEVVADLLYINIAWSLFNLLPVLAARWRQRCRRAFRAAGGARAGAIGVDADADAGGHARRPRRTAILGAALELASAADARGPHRLWCERAHSHDPAAATGHGRSRPSAARLPVRAIEIIGWARRGSGPARASPDVRRSGRARVADGDAVGMEEPAPGSTSAAWRPAQPLRAPKRHREARLSLRFDEANRSAARHRFAAGSHPIRVVAETAARVGARSLEHRGVRAKAASSRSASAARVERATMLAVGRRLRVDPGDRPVRRRDDAFELLLARVRARR